ncbi:hypothetical protein NHQ30_008275 [Ciborinia camelliae]|nr:hypothetical protein NHQ30_008275 [Ciborinia camelliae]
MPRKTASKKQSLTQHCGIAPTVDHSFIVPLLIFIIITGIAVALRLTSRFVTGTKFWWDDFFNVIAMASCIAFASQSFACAKLGLGTDIWAVPQNNITTLLKYSFVQFTLYNLSRCTIRASIILFLLRAFSVALRRVLLAMLIINGLVGFIFIFVDIFQCRPVDYFWLNWDGEHHGHCDNSRAIAWFSAIWDLCYDTVLVILPYRYVLKLQMPLKQKIAASIMFAVGICTIVVSIIRVKAVNTFTIGTNTTQDGIGMFLWTGLELDVGLLCACLPSIYPLFKPIFSRVLGTQGQTDSSSKPPLINSFNSKPKKPHRRGLYSDISMTRLTTTSSITGGVSEQVEESQTQVNDAETGVMNKKGLKGREQSSTQTS